MIHAAKCVKLKAGRRGALTPLHGPDHSDVRSVLVAAEQSKRCTKCGECKPLSAYSRDRRLKSGRASQCSACSAAQSRRYYSKNSVRSRATSAAWTRANATLARIARTAWAAANNEKVRASRRKWRLANRDKELAARAKWRAANPERHAEHVARAMRSPAAGATKGRRRAREAAAPGRGVTAAEWGRVRTDALGLCVYCNERRKLTMDHIVPLIRGGEHDADNIVAACKGCNSSKNDTPLLLWLARRAHARAA